MQEKRNLANYKMTKSYWYIDDYKLVKAFPNLMSIHNHNLSDRKRKAAVYLLIYYLITIRLD